MSPRREAKSLLLLSLKSVETLVQETIKRASSEIVRCHNECSKRDLEQRLAWQSLRRIKDRIPNEEKEGETLTEEAANDSNDTNRLDETFTDDESYETAYEVYGDVNYRKQMTMDFVERFRDHIFSHIPYSLIDDVKNKVCGSFFLIFLPHKLLH